MGVASCFLISILVYVKEVKVPNPRIVFHLLVRSAASDPTERERSRNRNIFIASPTPLGSSVWKARAITITATEWGVRGGQNQSS